MRISKKTHNQCKHIAVGRYRCARFFTGFPYLDSIINYDNSISAEITHRIKTGNGGCYSYKGLMASD
jgi:hypothetical protein